MNEEAARTDLLRYVTRLVVRPETAEDIVQTAMMRALSAGLSAEERRRWLFRVASNLAIDELRRQKRWGESALLDARSRAESDDAFVSASVAMRGTPEVTSIARQHLAFCFGCTLRNLDGFRAAALLLREVYAFSVEEVAEILGASPNQAKNWLQEARAAMTARYERTCALISKQGVCYQCSELAEFFNGAAENPLERTAGTVADRAAIVRQMDEKGLTKWHRLLLAVLDEL